ncbi:MAG TPA: hypothetical protein DCM05_15685 [Elusimicrobia bacterium]|nr:hypothetical protein [Elusimicrobiota bacterium]
MKGHSNRRWLFVVGAVLALPLAGLLFLRPKKDSKTLEAGALTADMGALPADAPPLQPGGPLPAPADAPEEGSPEADSSSDELDLAAAAAPGDIAAPGLPMPGGRLEGLQAGNAGAAGGGGAALGSLDKPGASEGKAPSSKGAEPDKPASSKGASAPAKPRARLAQDPGTELERAISLGQLGPGVGSANPFLKALMNAKGKPGALLFDPKKVIASGGRAGQGSVSMESNSKVTPENFNSQAAGLSSSKGKEPPGPKIPAGKAPALPSAHLKYILQASQATGVDPALIAATAARESNFRFGAYRAEPHLKQVTWRESPGSSAKKFFDGSLGPMQVLRSNFLSRGVGSDAQANDLATNYRIGAQIIRGDLNAFPNNTWKAVAAYNVGVYGAKIGRIPANNYTNTILEWRREYDKAIAPYR